jgi:cystathionine beta-lyase family protein involved in aluminum resistance
MCRKSMKDAIDTGKIVSPQRPCGVYTRPSNLEVRIACVIKRVRQHKLLVFLMT